METMQAIILCNNPFAIPAIRELIFYRKVAAIVIPGSNVELEQILKMTFSEMELSLVNRKSLKPELLRLFRETGAVCGMVMSFPYRLDMDILSMPPRGFFNFHFGSLPKYRGPEPIFAQIKNGEPFAGITVHIMTEIVDGGPVCMEERILINEQDSYGMVQSRLAWTSAALAVQLMKQMGFSELIPSRPQEEKDAGWCGKPGLEDVLIDWKKMNSLEIRNLVNACNPWNKGAGARIKNQMFGFLEVEILTEESSKNLEAGTIVSLNSGGLLIATKDKKILKVNLLYCPQGFMSGKRVSEFGIREGDCFD